VGLGLAVFRLVEDLYQDHVMSDWEWRYSREKVDWDACAAQIIELQLYPRYKLWILQNSNLNYFFLDPPSHSTTENDPPVTPVATATPAFQRHDSLHISQNNTILTPVFNGVRPTSIKEVAKRTDSKKGPKSMPLLKRKESWVEPDHVSKKSKLFRPRDKKITGIMYWQDSCTLSPHC
jgi:hypothetical protein